MELTIGVRDLKRLVNPVLPCVGRDDMLPVLTAVSIESHGTHLVAIATDRFRLAVQRVAAPSDSTWPEFKALVPASALKSIFATFKPSYRDADPQLILTVVEDQLSVDGDGPLDGMLSAAVSYRLSDGTFPGVRHLIRQALATDEGGVAGVNPRLISGVLPSVSDASAIALKIGRGPRDPLVFTDGADFIGVLMPRRLNGQEATESATFPKMDDWDSLLADPEPAAKKRSRKKSAAPSTLPTTPATTSDERAVVA